MLGTMKIRYSKLTKKQRFKLLEHFVAGATANINGSILVLILWQKLFQKVLLDVLYAEQPSD
jgi:hypothetical protein